MNYDMKRSGAYIQNLRAQRGYTQNELAKAMNINQSSLSRIELGAKGCSVDLFIQLAELFDVSLDYLILGRYCDALPKAADTAQLKSDIDELIDRLTRFRESI